MLKEKIEQVCNQINTSNNKEIISRIGEVKGLYSAYELSKSNEILEKIIELLLDIIESGIEINSFNTKKALKNKNNNSGELAGYYDFLIKQGKTPTTSDAYRKAINQVMKKRGYSSLEELNGHLDYEIEYYRHNDKKSHNTHIAALMQYKLYLTINAEVK